MLIASSIVARLRDVARLDEVALEVFADLVDDFVVVRITVSFALISYVLIMLPNIGFNLF
jgi:hypothetical protein